MATVKHIEIKENGVRTIYLELANIYRIGMICVLDKSEWLQVM